MRVYNCSEEVYSETFFQEYLVAGLHPEEIAMVEIVTKKVYLILAVIHSMVTVILLIIPIPIQIMRPIVEVILSLQKSNLDFCSL